MERNVRRARLDTNVVSIWKVDQRRAAVEEKEQRTNAIPWAGGDGTSEPNNIRSSMGRSYFLLLI
jgi:hypothetical protein